MYTQIETIIFEFYKKATKDLLIGYHFKKIKNFEEHIPHIAIFWFNRLTDQEKLASAKPFSIIQAHQPLGIKVGEVDRWVVLFKENLQSFKLEEKLKQKWLKDIDHFAKMIKEKVC